MGQPSYNKKTKAPTLMEFFTATRKLKKFFLTTRDVRCVHYGRHGTRLPHTRQNVDACVAKTLILYRCVSCHPWCTHRTSLVVRKKKLFQFFCDCEEFHWGRSFGFLVINVCNHGEHYETPCIIVRRAPHSVALLLKPLKHRLIMSLRSGIQNCFIVDPYLFKPTNFDSVYAIHLDRRIYETKFTSHLNVLFPFPISRTAVTFPSTLTTFVLFAVAVLSRDQSAVNCATET